MVTEGLFLLLPKVYLRVWVVDCPYSIHTLGPTRGQTDFGTKIYLLTGAQAVRLIAP